MEPRSFAAVVSGAKPLQPPRPISRYKGVPGISFSLDDVSNLTASLKFSLVGTFWNQRPKLEGIRYWFEKVGFLGGFKIILIDIKHILILFDQEADYIRCFSRCSWNVLGFHMRITKWSYDFDPKVDAPIVSVWVSLPGLPMYLHKPDPLFDIVRMMVIPLKADHATTNLLRPSMARICVEIDVSKDLPAKVFIQSADFHFFNLWNMRISRNIVRPITRLVTLRRIISVKRLLFWFQRLIAPRFLQCRLNHRLLNRAGCHARINK